MRAPTADIVSVRLRGPRLRCAQTVQNEQPQLAVEHIQAQDIVEAGSGLEGVVPTTLLEGNHVRRKRVAADLPQVPQSPVLVRYGQAAGPHALDELLMGEASFAYTSLPRARGADRRGDAGTSPS